MTNIDKNTESYPDPIGSFYKTIDEAKAAAEQYLSVSDVGYVTLYKVPTDNYKGSHFYTELDEGDLPDVVGLCSLDLAIPVSVYL